MQLQAPNWWCLVPLLGVVLVLSPLPGSCQMSWDRPQPVFQHCRPRVLPVDQRAATCSLEIVGYGSDKPGVKKINLNCTSDDPTYRPLVGVARAFASSLWQQLQPSLGVQLQRDLPCQRLSETPDIDQDLWPLYALLYFCSGNIQMARPVIRDLYLPYRVYTRLQEHTAAVAFAGSVRAVVTGAVVERVNASTAFTAIQEADLVIDAASFRGNVGKAGSAVVGRGRSTVTMRASNVSDSSSYDFGGAVAFIGCCNATVVDCRFTNNSAATGGGAVNGGESATVVLSRTLVSDNNANRWGGGILSYSELQLINGTKVLNNVVRGSGGGVYVHAQGGPAKLRLTADTVVWNNTATDAASDLATGGGIYLGGLTTFDVLELKTANVTGNKAARDSDIGVDPASVTFLSSSELYGYVSRPGDGKGLLRVRLNVSGEGGFPCADRKVSAFLQPVDGSSAHGETGRRLQQVPATSPDQSGGTPSDIALFANRTSRDGVVEMAFKLERPPGRHQVLFVVDTPYDLFKDMTVHVRRCQQGEKPVPGRMGVCELCPNGTYNFAPGDCEYCPTHASCPGGDVIMSSEGFWQSARHSSQVHRCPNQAACAGDRTRMLVECRVASNLRDDSTSLPAGCLDGSNSTLTAQTDAEFAQQLCSEGYRGNLCGRCAEWFGSTRPFQCRHCYPRSAFIGMYTLASLLLLALMKLLCWVTLKDNDKQQQTSSTVASGDEPKAEASHLLRQLVLHAQYTLIIASVQAVEYWPPTITKPLHALALLWAPASPETLAPDCAVWYASLVMSPGVVKVVFYIVTPVVLLVLLLVLEVCIHKASSWAFAYARHRGLHFYTVSARSNLADDLIAAVVVVVFFFLPTIVRVAVGLFACKYIDDVRAPPETQLAVGSFWIHDTNQPCFVGWHLRLSLALGIPLLLFVAAIPLYILGVTLSKHKSTERHVWRKHYDVLVRYYDHRHRYWEAVVATETIILVALSVFSYTLGPYYQALVMNVNIAVIVLLLALFKPLAQRDAQHVAVAGMACLFLTSYSAMTFAQSGGRAGSTKAPELQMFNTEAAAIPSFMGVVVVAINTAFVSWVLWKLARLLDWRAYMQTVVRVCSRICPCCVHFMPPSDASDGANGAAPGAVRNDSVLETVPEVEAPLHQGDARDAMPRATSERNDQGGMVPWPTEARC